MSDDYREWDAAYLLGALSPLERREYEDHLATCPACAAAVSQLAVLPGMLSRVPAHVAEQESKEDSAAPSSLLPSLLAAGRQRVRRFRLVLAGTLVAAAAVGAAVTLAVPAIIPENVSTVELALTPVATSPLEAEIRLVEHDWGTGIEMTCRYGAGDPLYSAGSNTYGMYLTDAEGNSTLLATWTAAAGSTSEPSATTSLALSEISRVDVRALPSGTVLLAGEP